MKTLNDDFKLKSEQLKTMGFADPEAYMRHKRRELREMHMLELAELLYMDSLNRRKHWWEFWK